MFKLSIKAIITNFIKGFRSFGKLTFPNIMIKDSVHDDFLSRYFNKIKYSITKNFYKIKSRKNEEKKHELQSKKA